MINKYKEYFCDTINSNLPTKKLESIYNSRKFNQDHLSFRSTCGNFSCSSPFVEKVENYIKELKFVKETSDLNKELLKFSKNHKTFEQFVNKNSKKHPRVFRWIFYPDDVDYLDDINWDKIIRLDIYNDYNYFEFWLVIKNDFFDIYVNKMCIISDVYNVNNLCQEENFQKLCDVLNVKNDELIKFIKNYII